MIGKISGRVDYVAEDHALIEAAGVGYIIYCSQPTLARLPGAGEPAALYTELVVREDLMHLYGFTTLVEREWHRLLTSVQGVGAKVSLAILGTLGPEGVARALALGDAAAVKSAPGVGPKLAARVVNELKDKAPAVMALGARAGRDATPTSPVSVAETPVALSATAARDLDLQNRQGVMADALSALLNLGYDRTEAARAVSEVLAEGEDAETPGVIRDALKRLAPSL